MSKQQSWYLLTSKPRQDAYAEEQLINQGYEVYRPLAKRLRKRQGKVVECVESLFPRYLFICLDQVNDNWGPIRSTYGVSGFVRFGDIPALVPNELIRLLKQQEDNLSEKAIDLDRFKKGEQVIIESGPFKGLQAVFECYDDGNIRSMVLLEMMGQLTRFKTSSTNLSRVA